MNRYGPALTVRPLTDELVPVHRPCHCWPTVALAGSAMVPGAHVNVLRLVMSMGPMAHSCQVCPPASHWSPEWRQYFQVAQ